MTPQLILTLGSSGQLIAELPGPAGRRQIELDNSPRKALAVIRRILEAQLREAQTIGLDAAPTQAQTIHWQRHCTGDIQFSDPMCTFCIAEGRFLRSDQSKDRAQRRVERESEHRTVKLGSGPDRVEVRRAIGYRTKFVTVRDEWDGLPQLMLRSEAKERGLKPLASEQRTQLGEEDLGI